jgi:hypothetical protein
MKDEMRQKVKTAESRKIWSSKCGTQWAQITRRVPMNCKSLVCVSQPPKFKSYNTSYWKGWVSRHSRLSCCSTSWCLLLLSLAIALELRFSCCVKCLTTKSQRPQKEQLLLQTLASKAQMHKSHILRAWSCKPPSLFIVYIKIVIFK